ncbi:hypothetical protein OUZ56_024421 [Daphnia magna]|uniref:Uncharacterized protein n=1 Tax=Daphnia magna TaxID=35525 RepID=A0ABR0B0S8_9CRUS|nr:hypothetical protein OUZ56_024421 [Daphnia magna]
MAQEDHQAALSVEATKKTFEAATSAQATARTAARGAVICAFLVADIDESPPSQNFIKLLTYLDFLRGILFPREPTSPEPIYPNIPLSALYFNIQHHVSQITAGIQSHDSTGAKHQEVS